MNSGFSVNGRPKPPLSCCASVGARRYSIFFPVGAKGDGVKSRFFPLVGALFYYSYLCFLFLIKTRPRLGSVCYEVKFWRMRVQRATSSLTCGFIHPDSASLPNSGTLALPWPGHPLYLCLHRGSLTYYLHMEVRQGGEPCSPGVGAHYSLSKGGVGAAALRFSLFVM